VEHGGGANASAEVLRIGGDREQRLGGRAEQQVVDYRLVLVGDRGDLGGQRENDVEIADRQQIGLAGREPILRRCALTLWAMAIAAGNGRCPLPALWGASGNGELAAGRAVDPLRNQSVQLASRPFRSP
jgi:hypothetical protein